MSGPERLPSPLRPLEWDGAQWIASVVPAAEGRYRSGAVQAARQTWGAWASGAGIEPALRQPATEAAVRYLQLGLPSDVVSALVLTRVGAVTPINATTIEHERRYLQRVLKDIPELIATGVITSQSGDAVQREYTERLEALSELRTPLAVKPTAVRTPSAVAVTVQPVAPAPPPPPPPPRARPAAPPISLRAVFAEHSVLILASIGAFLLVVATVLFELYGTIGLGGMVRLAAVVVLALLFSAAGFFARRRKGLESVGQIYIGLAAVLLPLVGLAAWTFLNLGSSGITVYQALAITALACAAAYGLLAQRLELRAYGAMAGLAVMVSAVGVSGWIGGDYWLPVGVALTPAVYAVWQRMLRSAAFTDFQWFAHASFALAAFDAIQYPAGGWLWTLTLTAGAVSYLFWNALAQQAVRAWIGEGAAIMASAAASGPLGLTSFHFALPLVTAVPLVLLLRAGDRAGAVAARYRPHLAHVHAAVVAGLALSVAEAIVLDQIWPVAAGLSIATGVYALDYVLVPTVLTGAALRAAALLALATLARSASLGPWSATVTAFGLVAFAIPFTTKRLVQLRAFASSFYYVGFFIVLDQLYDLSSSAWQWPVTAAFAVSAVGFGLAAELGAVRFGAYTARAAFAVAWFAGVDALGARDWRGPFDSLLALFYVALGQARRLVGRTTATAGRRWLVHASAAGALVLCFDGGQDTLWWRLAAAAGGLAVAYWWLATVRTELELPALAWFTTAFGAASLALAVLPLAWAGAGMSGAAVLLTAGWWFARRRLGSDGLDWAGLAALTLLTGTGMTLASIEGWLSWAQAASGLFGAAFFIGWSLLDAGAEMRLLRPIERSAASASFLGGLAVAAAVLKLDVSLFGLGALAAASLHAEWAVRTRSEIERWYAIGVLLGAAPAIFYWAYSNQAPEIAAIELAGLAVLVARCAVRSKQWWLAWPAVLVLAPALQFALVSAGATDAHVEEIAFAALAWAVGLAGLIIRTRTTRRWSLSTEAGAATIAVTVLSLMGGLHDLDYAGLTLLAYSPLVYAGALQERSRYALPGAPAAALLGVVILLSSHGADTIYYAAALGVCGLVMWLLGIAVYRWIGRSGIVEMHRYVGLGLLGAAGIAGFGFPDRTGAASLGAVLATIAFVATGVALFFDARIYDWRPNVYVAIVTAATAAFFAARFVNLGSWELVGPGLGLITAGIALRRERAFHIDVWLRRLAVAAGLGLVFGWAAALAITGDIWWLVALLIEGALALGAGVALRSRVLLGGGGGAIALASLRALLLIAQAGYLFIAFGAVALVLLIVATALALGRERYLGSARDMREQLATWD